MAILNRKIYCDVCGKSAIEKAVGGGWQGGAVINGIGAKEPEPDTPIAKENLETCLCPECTEKTTQFITDMQEAAKKFIYIVPGSS